LKGGAGGDRFIYQTASEFAAGETVDGAGGYDSIEALVSMSFLGNGITNVEQITAFYGSTVTISGANAAKIGTVAGAYNNGTTETFIVQLASGQTTNLGSFVLAGTSQGSDMGDSLTINGTAGNETVELSGSVLTFNGGDGADIVTISQYSNYGVGSTIRGEGGNDRIDYRGSNVAIDGGAGFDTLVVRNGETVDLSNAADQVTGGGVTTNFEHVDGSASTTALTLTGRNDVSSRLTGGSAADTLTAGAAGATLDGNAGANILQGAQGDDLLIWRNAASSYLGGDGVDTLRFAAAGAYTAADFALTTGLETVALANGVNSLTLGEAVLSGMSNNRMTLIGGDDADSIFIGDLDSGTVTVQTGDGEDALDLRIQFSGARFRGDLGLENDRVTLYGSNSAVAGAIDAGEGRDLLLYDYRFGFSATMASNLTGFEDVDLIDPSTPSNQVYDYVFNANDTADLTVYAGAEQRWTINLGDSGQVAQGNRLSDHLNGGDGDDELYGNIGIDWLDGGAGDDYMDGGEGDDFLILRPDDADEYFGGSGYDTLVVQTEQTLILPTTFGDTSIEHIDASAATGAQILWAFDNITIDATGSAFADTYNISHGYIFAGEGADRIAIGSGSSSLTANGQGGADIFEFQAAPIFNIKLDFVSGQDKLEFADNLFAGMSASTFLTQQTVTNGQAVTYTADLLRFGFLATQAQVQSYMNSNGTVDHAFAIDGAGHLYFIDDGAITYLAEGVSSIAMSDFLFT
jgi:Ca2+-binding RTX toxin-like protein